MRQYSTDPERSLLELSARTDASGDAGHTGNLATFFGPEQSVLVDNTDKLGDDGIRTLGKAQTCQKKRSS